MLKTIFKDYLYITIKKIKSLKSFKYFICLYKYTQVNLIEKY